MSQWLGKVHSFGPHDVCFGSDVKSVMAVDEWVLITTLLFTCVLHLEYIDFLLGKHLNISFWCGRVQCNIVLGETLAYAIFFNSENVHCWRCVFYFGEFLIITNIPIGAKQQMFAVIGWKPADWSYSCDLWVMSAFIYNIFLLFYSFWTILVMCFCAFFAGGSTKFDLQTQSMRIYQ